MFVGIVESVRGATASWLPMTGSDCADLVLPVCKQCSVFCFVPQSPEEIDKEERPETDAKKKSDEPGDDTDVFTEKHSENLFQRTEVLAGEVSFTNIQLARNSTENRKHPYQIMQTQCLCFLDRSLNTFMGVANG